jgi:hypothetical protein
MGLQRASEIQAAFAEKVEAEQHLFDEAMFDRVGEEADDETRPATLTFRDESELEPGAETDVDATAVADEDGDVAAGSTEEAPPVEPEAEPS